MSSHDPNHEHDFAGVQSAEALKLDLLEIFQPLLACADEHCSCSRTLPFFFSLQSKLQLLRLQPGSSLVASSCCMYSLYFPHCLRIKLQLERPQPGYLWLLASRAYNELKEVIRMGALPMRIPRTTKLPPYGWPSCMRSKLQASITPQAMAFAKAAHSLESEPTKKNGSAPRPAAPAMKMVSRSTLDVWILEVPPSAEHNSQWHLAITLRQESLWVFSRSVFGLSLQDPAECAILASNASRATVGPSIQPGRLYSNKNCCTQRAFLMA